MTRRLLPSTGSPGTGSPASRVLRGAPTPRRPSRRAPFPSPGGTALASLSSLARPAGTLRGTSPGFGVRSPDRSPPDRGGEVSQVPGVPTDARALFSDPGGTGAPGPYGAQVLPSALRTASAPTTRRFRGSIARPARLPVYASPHGSPRETQDSVPAGGQPLPGRSSLPGTAKTFRPDHHHPLSAELPVLPSFLTHPKAVGASPLTSAAPLP
jgi:hypothetical protein